MLPYATDLVDWRPPLGETLRGNTAKMSEAKDVTPKLP
jgi:hypothetical protein